ncbi:MAG: dipeptidase [Polyangiales bacterium]
MAESRDPGPAAQPPDAPTLARALGISPEAAEIYLASDVVDLHVDSFIWTRVLGYDLRRRHGRGLLSARYYSQVDFPRMREAGVSGALWSITTNPLRGATGRAAAFGRNISELERICTDANDQVALVRNLAEYRAARAAGRHAVMIAVQGGNALDRDAQALDVLKDGRVLAVTLVHLSRSGLGGSSSPLDRGAGGLTDAGRAYVERLDALRVFVDLAHIDKRAFSDAVAVHDKSRPLLVSHTGVDGVCKSWRNIDDAQLRAVADTGGVVGVIFHGGYLGGSYFGGGRAELIVDHLAHIVRVVGEDHAALGSDWDGAIITPRDMPTCLELPRLVQHMLERGFSPQRVQKILGGNFLRALQTLRG